MDIVKHNSKRKKSQVQLHIAVILFGFTAILGDLIDLNALMIVWWRVAITVISLLFLTRMGKNVLSIPIRSKYIFISIGFIIGLHWLCFYGAVKLSNASITLICMATTCLFTALIEPIFVKGKKFDLLDIGLGVAIVPCMFLCVQGAHLSNLNGVWVGLLSALLASVFTILNKIHMKNTDTLPMTLLEIFGVWILISIIIPIYKNNNDFHLFPNSISTWFYLFVLAILCTTVAWVLSLKALKYVSAFEANLVVNLEPVYGIFLAAVILKEYQQLTSSFYIGAALIVLIIVFYSQYKSKSIS